ncbi:MAG: hypothetical protein F4012_09215 [Gemmatimonadales bacterium]|nr:hypothetical protein [Gemmatimonadales bacterium]
MIAAWIDRGRVRVRDDLPRPSPVAEWLRVPVPNLHRVPEPLPDEVAVFAEPVAAACRVLRQIEADIRRDLDRGRVTRALVVGAGRLGQLVARVLARRLPELEVAGRSERSLARARAAGLATVSAAAVEAAAYDLVVDCSGASAGFAVARQAVRPRGTMILKGTHKNELAIDISSIVVDEIRLLGSRCGSFEDALSTLERREFEVRDLIDDRLPLSAAPEAFEQAAEAGVAKVLLVP